MASKCAVGKASQHACEYLPVRSGGGGRPEGLNPLLPPPEKIFTIMVAPCGSGKTVALVNLFLRKNQYRGFYPGGIFIFSPTALTDDSMRPLRESASVHLLGRYTDEAAIEFFQSRAAYIAESKDNDETPLTACLVLDDSVGDIRQGSAISSEILKHRHFDLGVVITTQAFREIPTQFRGNASLIFLWRCRDHKEQQKLQESYGNQFGDVGLLLRRATAGGKHNFLLLTQGLAPRTEAWRGMGLELLFDADSED